MTKKVPCFLIADLSSQEIQAALKSAVDQNFHDAGITIRRDNDKPNTIIVAAKQEIARFIVLDKIPKEPNVLFIEPPYEKLAKDINEVMLEFTNKNTNIVIPKLEDFFTMDKKRQKLNHKKNTERIIGNRYVNAQFNQLKKIIHKTRTRHR